MTSTVPSGRTPRTLALRGILRTQPDSRLARLIRDGNIEAREELGRRYRPGLVRLSRSLGAEPQAAKSIAAEALRWAEAMIEEGDAPGSIEPWMGGVVRRATATWLGHRPDPALLAVPLNDAAAQLEQQLRVQALVTGVAARPGRERAALIGNELQSRRGSSAAVAMTGAARGVRSALSAARDRLRARRLGRLVPPGLIASLANPPTLAPAPLKAPAAPSFVPRLRSGLLTGLHAAVGIAVPAAVAGALAVVILPGGGSPTELPGTGAAVVSGPGASILDVVERERPEPRADRKAPAKPKQRDKPKPAPAPAGSTAPSALASAPAPPPAAPPPAAPPAQASKQPKPKPEPAPKPVKAPPAPAPSPPPAHGHDDDEYEGDEDEGCINVGHGKGHSKGNGKGHAHHCDD